jgi:hypothetical protein
VEYLHWFLAHLWLPLDPFISATEEQRPFEGPWCIRDLILLARFESAEDPEKALCMTEAPFSVQDKPLLVGDRVGDGAVLIALEFAVV